MRKIQSVMLLLIIALVSVSSLAATNLKLNLEKDKVYKFRTSTNQNIQQSFNGQSFSMEMKTNMVISFKIIGQENENILIEAKIDSMTNLTSSPMGKKEIEFAKPAKEGDWEARLYNEIIKPKYVVKISTSGKFMGINNFKTIKDALTILMDSVPATKKDKIQMLFNNLIKESMVQGMIEPFFAHLSEKALNAGEKWESTLTQNIQNFTLMMFNTYTLNSIDNNLASISNVTEYESVPSNEPQVAGAPQITPEIKGTVNTDMKIDLNTGLVESATGKGRMEGPITMVREGNTMKMNLAADTETTVKRID